MPFLKAHWVLLLSGVVAVASIGVTVVGLTADSVQREMTSRLSTASEIDSLMRNPISDDCINAELQRRQALEQEFKDTLAAAERISKRAPLLDSVFPSPAQLELVYRFQEAYRSKLYELPREMKASGLPTEQDVADEAEILADQEKKRLEQEAEGGGAAQPISKNPKATPQNPRMPPYGPFGPYGPYGPYGPGITPTAGGIPTGANVPAEKARERAAVKKARSIRTYATMDLLNPSFHISPLFDSDRPTPKEMWYAQVGLWVQQDVVSAIRALNDDAARALNEKDANVTHLPVKRLVNLRVLGYVTSAGLPVRFDSRGGAGGMGPEALPPSFTGRKSDEQFDVIRFTVTAIVDQRDLLKLVDYLSRANFYQLVSASYAWSKEMGDVDTAAGYFYGEEPVVQATLDFEGYLARKVYVSMMPADVKEELGIKTEPTPQ